MPEAFTVYWSRGYSAQLRRAGENGKFLRVLFGGQHTSCPSLVRAKVDSGDVVFPIGMQDGALHVYAGAVIHGYVPLDEYVISELGYPRQQVQGLSDYQIGQLLHGRFDEFGHRFPIGCGTEVALVERSTPISFRTIVPPDQLATITFAPRKGPPQTLRNVKEGRLLRSMSLDGHIRRLTSETAELFAKLSGLDLDQLFLS